MAIILVIDDSPTEAKSVANALEKNGFTVHWANNATKGLEMAETINPDLILMDVVMPGMNGFQATRKLSRSESTKSIPVIMLTTKDQETDKIWGIRQGAKDYVVKPASEDELIEKITALIGPR